MPTPATSRSSTRSPALANLVRNTRRGSQGYDGLFLCLDPGETTGWALFKGPRLVEAGEFRVTSPLLFDHLVGQQRPGVIVCENYKVYGHRAQQHIGSEVPTIRYIGYIQFVAAAHNLPLVFQMAYQAKGFVKDQRLIQLGLWHESKHARDAIRHGVYWLMFGKTASL